MIDQQARSGYIPPHSTIGPPHSRPLRRIFWALIAVSFTGWILALLHTIESFSTWLVFLMVGNGCVGIATWSCRATLPLAVFRWPLQAAWRTSTDKNSHSLPSMCSTHHRQYKVCVGILVACVVMPRRTPPNSHTKHTAIALIWYTFIWYGIDGMH